MLNKFLDRLMVSAFALVAFWPEVTVVVSITIAATIGLLR